MKAVIQDKREVANDTLWLRFHLTEKINFKAGQFFFITIPNLLYKDDRGATRHFSIVNSPLDNEHIEMTTRLTGSGFKKTLQELPIGSGVEIKSIGGEFILPEDDKKPIAYLAGGIGITPFMSMIRYIKNKNKFNYRVILIRSDDSLNSAPFIKELEEFALASKNFKIILTITRDPNFRGEKRHINESFLKDYLQNPKEYAYMVSGPPSFVIAMNQLLSRIGVKDVKTERFVGYK